MLSHLVDYFKGGHANPADNQPTGDSSGWGIAGDRQSLWSVEELNALRLDVEQSGLRLAAVENIDPAHWYDVLLDGPLREEHIENVRTIIRRLGRSENTSTWIQLFNRGSCVSCDGTICSWQGSFGRYGWDR